MASSAAAVLLSILLISVVADAAWGGSAETDLHSKGGHNHHRRDRHHNYHHEGNVDGWYRSFQAGKEKVTQLHFYFHDTVSGQKPSAVPVARAAGTGASPTGFGLVVMADDPLTEGPEPTSRLVGRAQGLYGSAGQEELSLIMALSYSFADGEYNDSSLSIMGRNPASHPVRELAIVGGTGVFRMARGFAVATTYSFNPSGDAVVEYNVTAIHY